MPEYDETAATADEQSAVATAADDESVEAASEPEYRRPPSRPRRDDEFDPVAELRQKLRYAPGDWYVVHSYAGYENKVKTNLETRITSLDMEEFIFQVEVPTREEVEVKNGKRIQVQNKVFPGYILVRMELTPESYSCVRNTPGRDRLRRRDRPGRPAGAAVARRGAQVAGARRSRPSRRRPSPRSRSSTSRSATRSPSPTARSPRCRPRSARSTPTSRSSRCWCRSSVGRPRSSSTSTRSPRSNSRCGTA